ncbi:type II secretion system (T2SS) protein F [Humibacillus xanthopallidus]|uniref:Type II secretion system (T2SS) protein F n=1 Tax=Humibacillus xanthopallidus TaxID=412689 RepID=A0A543PMH4_9MICO|nr:type II secretion system F family protein [Humibacillus xanthopallidus]TQN45275.1 type II secretion system (T2SS) protein F [Humibacillus xanthopallidus]
MTWPVICVAVLLAGAVLVLPTRVDADVQHLDVDGSGAQGVTAQGAAARSATARDATARDVTAHSATEQGVTAQGATAQDVTSVRGRGLRGGAPADDHGERRWVGPRARRSGRGRAEHRDADEVAAAMALLALAYRTGLPTWQVLTAVAQTSADPVGSDLRQVATALQWGASEAEAWASVGPAWAAAARVVSLAHAGGVPPGPLLTAASDDLHRAELDRLEVAAAQVGVRLVAPLGLVLLPAFCLTAVVPLVVALGGQLLVG